MTAMCGVQVKGGKNLMWMLGLNETIDQLAMASKQCLLAWSCVEERGWSCTLKGIRVWGQRALDFGVKGH